MATPERVATPAQRIKEALTMRNMKQTELSNITGICKPAISSYVTGKYNPKPVSLFKIAKALDVSEEWLSGLDVQMQNRYIEKNDDCGNLHEQNTISDESQINKEADDVFSKKLIRFAQRLGINQNQIAEKMKVAKSTVSYWFNGRSIPPLGKMQELANLLGISVSDLVDEETYGIPENDRKIMAKNIKRYMEKNDVNRQQLCEALGFNYSTLSEWLQGENYPRIEKISAMAKYFGCKKSDLIEEYRETQIKVSVQLDNDVIEFLNLYQQCDLNQRQCVKQLMVYITKKTP